MVTFVVVDDFIDAVDVVYDVVDDDDVVEFVMEEFRVINLDIWDSRR